MKSKIFNKLSFFVVFFVVLFQFFLPGNSAKAQGALFVGIDNPIESTKVTSGIYIKGWAFGENPISKVEIFLDNTFVGQATYGIKRTDIKNSYPTYTNSEMSGYTYKLTNVSVGQHNIKIIATDTQNQKIDKSVSITVSDIDRVNIMGTPVATKEQAVKYFFNNNNSRSREYVDNFVKIVWDEAGYEGVRADIAFSQMMLETGFLTFKGDVREEQNNFAGLGAVGGGASGASFPDIRTGIRAVVQHLKAYASADSLRKTCVDPRFSYVKRGASPIVEYLSINVNPDGYGWASDPNYGYKILNHLNAMKSINISGYAFVNVLNIANTSQVQNQFTLTASGESKNSILYRFWVGNLDTGYWSIIQNYSQQNTVQWRPNKSGHYRLLVQVKDINSSNDYDDILYEDKQVEVQSTAVLQQLNVPSQLSIGKANNISASAQSSNGVLYKFWICDWSVGWKVIQDYSESSTVNWDPEKAGGYRILVQAKDKNSASEYDDIMYIDKSITTSAVVNSLTLDDNLNVSKPTIIKAQGSSTNGILYRFWSGNLDTGEWNIIQNYSESNTVNWTPNKPGNFRLLVQVKDKNSIHDYEQIRYQDTSIDSKAIAQQLTVPNELIIGKPNKISAAGTSYNGLLYRFLICDWSVGWKTVQDYSQSNIYNWTPEKPGDYRILVQMKDKNSKNDYDDLVYVDKSITTTSNITSLTVDENVNVSRTTTIKADGTAPNGVLFRFWIGNLDTGEWNIIQNYSSNNVVNWTPNKAGNFRILVQVKDKNSIHDYEQIKYEDKYVFRRTIVIDPGHNYGGDDGAYARYPNNTYVERDLNMQVSLKVKGYLESYGYNIILTRQESDRDTLDAHSSLDRRAQIANNANADLFISIHHDSSSNSNTTGISTHYSSYKPNIDTSGVVVGNDPNGWYRDVNIDTTPSDAAKASEKLAKNLVDGLSSSLGYNNLKSHDHNLYVTVNTNMPAVLIECGFISNINEAGKCADSNEQDKKARVIAQTIDNFFRN
ncbi:N-acetylmuramoyl-L-alanine amidase [Clostridiales bacterium oral taxon 876 str. F0540]|nr:N-acetylmuramoyl-L-alanine amidase [Clostridiales bacterium oral taxon 876 str. F0540]